MVIHKTTYLIDQLNRYAGMIFITILGAVILSCPASRDKKSPRLSGSTDLDISGLNGSNPLSVKDDESAGVDAEGAQLKEELRIGDEVPLETGNMEIFFNALTDLSNGKRDKVRVIHYGDSHTAADFFTTAVRRKLQQRFSDGGRGFVLLGNPWRSYNPKDLETVVTGNWTPERILIAADPAILDGYYGLAGITTETTDKFARSIVKTSGEFGFGKNASLFDLFYLTQPDGGSFSVLADGKQKGFINTKSPKKRTGFFSVKVKNGPHEFEVRTSGDGEVRLFGAAVESDKGLVYDTLGVNGGFFNTPHRWNEEELQKQIQRRDPQLLVTMYGTNETGSRVLTRQNYKSDVLKTMNKFKGGLNDASCLMFGPPDSNTDMDKQERLSLIIDVQKEVADEMGCLFIDLREMMGGEGSHLRWEQTTPAMAQPDGIHLTVKGYMFLGELAADRILAAYDNYISGRTGEEPEADTDKKQGQK
ncbi:MAG: hypothetical protein JXR91_06160 [Deltaproteobacteria bacterium]|nr:hypothetical protein [Deltaproteobacteria bacterium]